MLFLLFSLFYLNKFFLPLLVLQGSRVQMKPIFTWEKLKIFWHLLTIHYLQYFYLYGIVLFNGKLVLQIDYMLSVSELQEAACFYSCDWQKDQS